MSWQKMDSNTKTVAIHEILCMVIAILAGIGLGYMLPHHYNAAVRYIGGFLFGWYVIDPILIKMIAHRGVDVDDLTKRL